MSSSRLVLTVTCALVACGGAGEPVLPVEAAGVPRAAPVAVPMEAVATYTPPPPAPPPPAPTDATLQTRTERVQVELDERSSKLYFQSNSTTLRSVSQRQIAEIAGLLRVNPSVQIEIVGFVNDYTPDDLDYRRAAQVRDLLIAAGVDATRMKATGAGRSTVYPSREVETSVDSDGSVYQHNRNMRVEIRIVDV